MDRQLVISRAARGLSSADGACLTARRVILLATAACLLWGTTARAAKPENTANTSRAAMQEAAKAIPKDKLDDESRRKVGSVLSNVSIFRRLPTQVIECDPHLYLYLVEHPEVVVNMWEVMGVSEMLLRKTGPDTFIANDGVGTVGAVEFLHRSHDTHVMYAEGKYDGPLFVKPVYGKCVLVLRTGYVREPNDRYYITCRLDAFIQVENLGVELVARTFQPLVGKTADHNFRETAAFLGLVSRTAETNPAALERLTEKMSRVDAESVAEFRTVVENTRLAAAEREAQRAPIAAKQTPRGRTATKPAASPQRMR